MYSKFIFIDLETTGLVPSEGYILELGMAIYNSNLEMISSFHNLVATKKSMEFIKSDKWKNTPFAYEMHQKSGLNAALSKLGECAILPGGSCNINTVFNGALAFARNEVGDLKSEPLCGNSLGFDRAWLAHHVPVFNNAFSYRNIDCSGMFEYVKKRAPGRADAIQRVRKQSGNHRPLADIQDSVNLLKAMQRYGAIL